MRHHVYGCGIVFAVGMMFWGNITWGQTTRWVGGANTPNYSTIASALAACAASGDTVWIDKAEHIESNITVSVNVTIRGNGATNTIVQAAAARGVAGNRIFSVSTGGKAVTFQDMTLRHGKTASGGGAIYMGANANVTVQDCIIEKNDDTSNAYNSGGGAICAAYDSGASRSLAIKRCTISENQALMGGSIRYQYSNGPLLIEDSLFVSNSSTNHGGAIYASLPATVTGTSVVKNCTFSMNRVVSPSANFQHGGGIYLGATPPAAMVVCNSSFVSNSACYGGGICQNGSATNYLASVLFAGNKAANTSYTEFYGITASISNCLWEGTASATKYVVDTGNQKNTGAGTAKVDWNLAWNNGPTRTHALLPGSLATNAGANPLGLSYDQRGAGYSREIPTGKPDIGAFEYRAGPIYLTYSTNTFKEHAGLNNGSIENATPILIDLFNNEDFTGTNNEDFASGGTPKVVVSNLPNNLTAVVSRVSASRLSVTLTGQAVNHANANDVTDLTFAFQGSAFAGGDPGAVAGSTNNALRIDFIDAAAPPVLTYNGNGFTEVVANNGAMDNSSPWTITVANDGFSGAINDEFYGLNRVTVANLPAGLTPVLTKTAAGTITVTITGNATSHNSVSNRSDVTFTFLSTAFTLGSAPTSPGDVKSDLTVTFRNPALTWSGSFTEALPANDGTIDPATLATATLVGDTFTGNIGSNMAGTFTPAHEPSGLTLVITKTSDTVATVALTGAATAHANANDVANLSITFGDTAFTAGNAMAVTNNPKTDLAIDFKDPSKTWYVQQTGSDTTGDGTALYPWATITKAITQATSWDTIHVLPGTLTERVTVSKANLTIEGDSPEMSIVQAHAVYDSASGPVFYCQTGNHTTMRNLTIQHGKNVDAGGGIYVAGAGLTVSNCVVTRNKSSSAGGGIYFTTGPAGLMIDRSTFSSNEAGANASGGGLLVYQNVPWARIRNSTFAGNSAGVYGGGMSFYLPYTASVENCTIIGNFVTGNPGANLPYHGGGGIDMYPGGTGGVFNCTIVSNSIPLGYGGGLYQYANMTVESTIIAGNTASNGLPTTSQHHRGSGALTERFNLVSISNAWFVAGSANANGSYVGSVENPLDPLLAPLANNGGQTMTCALQLGSLAIDKGSNPLNFDTDQRGAGFVRVKFNQADIGAYEFGAEPTNGTLIMIR